MHALDQHLEVSVVVDLQYYVLEDPSFFRFQPSVIDAGQKVPLHPKVIRGGALEETVPHHEVVRRLDPRYPITVPDANTVGVGDGCVHQPQVGIVGPNTDPLVCGDGAVRYPEA